ncbi:unnamed protein product [Agarophyton chilense]|eukprot:gb/GEZJ01001809.1/.p3 GENE.gb/GEZJ01001809.1/~~gb/GEZJ01001809.1/.p3  ORF type:complete len:221 (+),score=33.61 gb/GEZJ01001809.1/:163-825(+)
MAAFTPHGPEGMDEVMSDAQSDGNSTVADDELIHVSRSAFQPWRAEINRLALELTAEQPFADRTETERNHNRQLATITCNYQLVWLDECVLGVENSFHTGNVQQSPAYDYFNALFVLGPAQFIKWTQQVPKPQSAEHVLPLTLLTDLGMINTRILLKRATNAADNQLHQNVIKQLILLNEVLLEPPAPTILASLTPATARILYEHLRSKLDQLPTLLPHL